MAELNEHATFEEVKASYRRNASYEEDNSVTKARRFVTAIRFLLAMPKRTRKGGQGGGEAEFDTESLRAELTAAQHFIQASPQTGPDVIGVDFHGYRE